MKWQAIANVTNQVNEEAKGYLVRKLEKDASVEIPHLWADFIGETTRHLHDAQSNIEVASSGKTGGFNCITKFDEMHPDALESGKNFNEYALDKYDKRAEGYLANSKNPFTRKFLQAKIGDYRVHLADKINHTEIKLIDGKRHVLAIESIEKLKNATYEHPEIYQNHLQDCSAAINSLSLLPLEKEQLLHQAKSDLASAAATGTLKHSPDSLIHQTRLPSENQPLWLQHLSLEQRIKLETSVTHLMQQRQAIKQTQIKQLAKSHLASILKTGEGIKGFDNLLEASFSQDDPNYQRIKQQEATYKQSFILADQIKHASLNEGARILEQIAPKSGDPDYYAKEQMHNLLTKHYDEQLKQASSDPAKFVQELFSDELHGNKLQGNKLQSNEDQSNLSFPERLTKRIAMQEQKGIPDYGRKYLTKAEKIEFLRKIEDSKDINEIRNNINGIIALRDDSGNNYGLEVAKELFGGRDSELFINLYAENKLYGNDNIADIFLKMIPYKGQLFNSGEESKFNKIIADNKIISKWENGFYNQDTGNLEEINYTKQQIKYLALHYKKSGELSIEKAVSKATEEVIENRYMILTKDKLQIPKQIIADNMIHNLNEDYIEASLLELQRGIINGSINYDYQTSFGVTSTDATNEYEIARIKEVLQEGRWKITPDKKSIYFTFLTKDGSYLPLMLQPNKILKFDLTDLNNPESLERQKQNFLQALSDAFFEM